MSARFYTETLLPGTDEEIAYLLVPVLEMDAGLKKLRGTLLRDHPLADLCGGDAKYLDFKLLGYEHVGRMDASNTSYLRVSFSKDYNVVDDGKQVGTLVDTVPTSIESFPWPKVLTDISWNQVELKPNGDVTTGGTPSQYSSWSITPMFIDEYHGLTKVTERYYISNVPFDESIITAESLHPTNVHWELGGSNGNGAVTNCLTGGITTPAIVASGSSTVIRASTTFDATPQTAWVEHIFYDVVTRQNGLYFRLTKTAAPPPHTPGQS